MFFFSFFLSNMELLGFLNDNEISKYQSANVEVVLVRFYVIKSY